jgi:stage II sporulation protein AB (anti-sigma F factor)
VALRLGETIAPGGLTHVRVPSSLASLAHLRDVAEQFALSSPLSDQAAHEVVSAVQEAVLNCIRWAYPGREGPVYLTLSREAARMRVNVRDAGLGFDVAEAYARTSDGSNNPLRRSGRGLMLMHRLADRVELVSRPGRGTTVMLEKGFDVADAASASAQEAEEEA